MTHCMKKFQNTFYFMSKIPLDDGKKVTVYVRCAIKLKKSFMNVMVLPAKKKYGSVTNYWYKQCKIELYGFCFELYHTKTDYIKKY